MVDCVMMRKLGSITFDASDNMFGTRNIFVGREDTQKEQIIQLVFMRPSGRDACSVVDIVQAYHRATHGYESSSSLSLRHFGGSS
jgi:hypothetical protein